MKIKLMENCVAEITMEPTELVAFHVNAEDFSPRLPAVQGLLTCLFDVLETVGGLRRGGHVTFMECRPYISGRCLLRIGFTHQPGGRIYVFACADDLLDALNQLRCHDYFNKNIAEIHQSESEFLLYLPPQSSLGSVSAHDLAILSEYTLPV